MYLLSLPIYILIYVFVGSYNFQETKGLSLFPIFEAIPKQLPMNFPHFSPSC